MEASYIVRIYRRASAATVNPHDLVGIVEEVQTGRRSAFRDAEELLGILKEVTQHKPKQLNDG